MKVVERDGVTLYRGDCRDLLPEVATGAALILTDPPYGLDAPMVRNQRGFRLDKKLAENATVEGWREKLPWAPWFVEFGNNRPDAMVALVEAHKALGWTPWRWFVSVKPTPPPTFNPCFSSGFEVALVSFRGRRRWCGNRSTPDYWIGEPPARIGKSTGHPTEKAVGLLSVLIRSLTKVGDLVVDLFSGSGSTLVAARECGRKAVGVEIDPWWCEAMARRLSQGFMFSGSSSSGGGSLFGGEPVGGER